MNSIKTIIYKKENTLKPSIIKSALIATSLLCLSNSHANSSANWTGFYAGPKIGAVFNDVDLDAQHLGFTHPSGVCNIDSDFSSFFPGLQAGYAHQFDSKLVLGIEGDFTYNTDISKKLKCTCPPDAGVFDRFFFKNREQGSIRGRIGYALSETNNILPFVMAGASFANLGLKYNNEGGDYYTKNITKTGWLAGGGLSYLFSDKWSVGAEYFYTSYNNIDLRIPSVYGLIDANGRARGKLNTNNIAASLNHWF